MVYLYNSILRLNNFFIQNDKPELECLECLQKISYLQKIELQAPLSFGVEEKVFFLQGTHQTCTTKDLTFYSGIVKGMTLTR